MGIAEIRSFCARLIGLRYRQLPGFGGDARDAAVDTLIDLGATFCGESGSPAYELNSECFRIGRRKIHVCTEDHWLAYLWGSKALVEAVYSGAVDKLRARSAGGPAPLLRPGH